MVGCYVFEDGDTKMKNNDEKPMDDSAPATKKKRLQKNKEQEKAAKAERIITVHPNYSLDAANFRPEAWKQL